MRFVTLANGRPDGRLALLSRDGRHAVHATGIADTLQQALDDWDTLVPALQARAASLEWPVPPKDRFSFDPACALAPLPRAWQWLDGSAFPAHGLLMQKAFGLPPIESPAPLMYQGMSHRFLAGHEDVPLPDEADDIDFEGEFGVITGPVPMGSGAAAAAGSIRLLVLINDWSLRRIAPVEMKTGFGWVRAKPACSLAPIAVTPDELGAAWSGSRVQTVLEVDRDGARFGRAHGGAMAIGFDALIAHAAGSRDLCAGTIIGSGTVSNDGYREVGCSCISERRAIELIELGAPQTPFMRFGDRVRMEALDPSGRSVFGTIEQRVVRARSATAPS